MKALVLFSLVRASLLFAAFSLFGCDAEPFPADRPHHGTCVDPNDLAPAYLAVQAWPGDPSKATCFWHAKGMPYETDIAVGACEPESGVSCVLRDTARVGTCVSPSPDLSQLDVMSCNNGHVTLAQCRWHDGTIREDAPAASDCTPGGEIAQTCVTSCP